MELAEAVSHTIERVAAECKHMDIVMFGESLVVVVVVVVLVVVVVVALMGEKKWLKWAAVGFTWRGSHPEHSAFVSI